MYSIVPTITYIFVLNYYCMKLLFRSSKTKFNEAHILVIQEGTTTLLTVYGNFTLNKNSHNEH